MSKLVTACALVALALVGLAAYGPVRAALGPDPDFYRLGAPATACLPEQVRLAEGNAVHVPRSTQLTYPTAPPAYGPHWNEPGTAPALGRTFYTPDDRPELEALVHNLEHGYTLLWYDATTDERVVRQIAAAFEPSDKVIVAPWTAADEAESGTFPAGTHVAMTHWTASQEGVFEYCSEPSGAALHRFLDAHPIADSPEPGAP
jgi:hypothetical protein